MKIIIVRSQNKHLLEQGIRQSIPAVVPRPLHSIISKTKQTISQHLGPSKSINWKTISLDRQCLTIRWVSDEVLIAFCSSWEFTSMCQLEWCLFNVHFVSVLSIGNEQRHIGLSTHFFVLIIQIRHWTATTSLVLIGNHRSDLTIH